MKLIQALSCAGIDKLKVKITESETIFEFEPPQSWNRDVVTSLLEGKAPNDRSLELLKFVLELLIFSYRRTVGFRCSGEDGAVKWDEDSWQSAYYLPGFLGIRVAHLSKDEKKAESWTEPRQLARSRYVSVGSAIKEQTYFTPFDIKLDGVNLEVKVALLGHLIERSSALLHLTTYNDLLVPRMENLKPLFLGKQTESEQSFPNYPGLLLLSVETSRQALGDYLKSGLSTDLEVETQSSFCYWVADGVLVGYDRIEVPDSSVAVSLYVEANDLPFDLGTLTLLEGAEREKKLQEVSLAISGHIPNLEFSAMRLDEESKRTVLKLSGLAGIGSVIGFFLFASSGIAPLFVLAGLGSLAHIIDKSEPEEKEAKLPALGVYHQILRKNFASKVQNSQ